MEKRISKQKKEPQHPLQKIFDEYTERQKEKKLTWRELIDLMS